ncbi:DMT family transporter [Zhouia sp. PK063]|uniref:DMT family transporter n=1 Tax=Zhouia sp. PK063 TaxID=3373602 RepID=UPI0037963604
MQNDKLGNYLKLHLIVFIWGFTAVLGALITIDAIPLVWYRMLIASLFIAAFLWFKKINIKVSGRVLFGFIVTGILIALHWLCFFGAIKVANVSVTLATISTGAFFTAILEPIVYKRKIIWYELLFGALVIVGIAIIFHVETDYALGIVLALVAAFLASVFSLMNSFYVKKHKPSIISFYELSSGALFITLYLLTKGKFTSQFFSLRHTDWLYLFLLASICTAYAQIASVKVMRFISPFTVMLTTNLEPVYGIILAFIFLGENEKMSPNFYVGAVIILVTVILNGILKTIRKRKTLTY